MPNPFRLSDLQLFASDLTGPEGIAFDLEGAAYVGCCGRGGWVTPGPILRLHPDGSREPFADTEGRVLGLALDREGNLTVCDWARHEVVRVRPDGAVSVLADHLGSRHFWLPNFAVYDAEGSLYVSDSGIMTAPEPTGCIYRIRPAGAVELWADELEFPNGLALAADGSALYVVETNNRRVLRLAIRSDGTAGHPEVYAEGFAGRLDGLAFDSLGTLYVTVLGPPHQIATVETSGRLSVLVEDAEGVKMNFPTNCAFGGPGQDDLYIVSGNPQGGVGAGAVLKLHVGVKGQPLFGGSPP